MRFWTLPLEGTRTKLETVFYDKDAIIYRLYDYLNVFPWQPLQDLSKKEGIKGWCLVVYAKLLTHIL